MQSFLLGQAPQTEPPAPAVETEPGKDVDDQPEAAASPRQSDAQRTQINLLGQTDSQRGESRRNENVQFNLVDNNALKELNVRLGTTATLVDEFKVDQGYFGAEFGAPPTRPIHATGLPGGRAFHGSLFESHQNSVTSARAFFQVGDVKPARENNYGARVQLPLWEKARLSLSGSQIKLRGQVNGNVLVPLESERTALTTDPLVRPIVEDILSAYPAEAPNRTDIAARALNTNSPQSINTDVAGAQLDQDVSDADRLTFRYSFTGQNVDAFQFVQGQNPDTDTKNHSARITWNRVWSATTTTDTTVGYDRLGSLLLPVSGSRPSLSVGSEITGPAPPPPIPIDRAQNRFRYGSTLRHVRNRHTLTAGFALTRLFYNGEETDGHRGILSFNRSVENGVEYSAIDNLRRGKPFQLIQALGTTYRGFRNWTNVFFVGDQWRPTSDLTLTLGLRYEPVSRPRDATGRSNLQYRSDRNNFAPTFGLAYRLGDKLGVLRANYGLHYGEIFPVTYGQDRLNAPYSLRIVIQQPNLADPLGGLSFADLDPTSRTSKIELGPNMVVPYSHQYNLSWQFALARDWRVEAGYVGSRSHKLIQTYFLNRGLPVSGLPLTQANVNDRRADQAVFEHLFIHNGSHGYFDAGRASLVAPNWRGLTLNASYWFSKAIDTGSNYTNTASGPDARDAVSQTEFDSMRDIKALSNFDQPHAFLTQASYEILKPSRGGVLGKLFGGWTLSTVFLLKTGTPFSVDSGADGPGFGNVDGSRYDRPNVVDTAVLGRTIGDPDTAEQLLPRAAFAYIDAPAQLAGTLGRNTFRKGKIANVNASVARTFAVGGETRLSFRAESINFFNTPQFAEPTKSLTSPSFGQINNTLNDGRAFRFTLRFDW
ncbi:MAG: TonB-dependent receptor [Acidobacteria bacterium]|nr:TonB-dependent receptor [Acidobacteriota bacterium]